MKFRAPALLAPALLLVLFVALPAGLHAQATKIFVASTGSDANDGSRGNPKRTFQAAHDAVAAAGQIVVLDTSGYGALTITKSLAVTVPPGVNGFVTVSGGAPGIVINAGAADSIALRGLIIEGGGANQSSTSNGIEVNSAASVTVEDCTVRNFFSGIFTVNNGNLYLRRCTLRGCDAGLDLEPGNADSRAATIAESCRFEQGPSLGLFVSPSAGGNADVTLRNCVISGSNVGIAAVPSNAVAVVRVDNCRIVDNDTGISTSTGGQVFSRGNNTLENNSLGNNFPATYSAK